MMMDLDAADFDGVGCSSTAKSCDGEEDETSRASGFECNICLDVVEEPVVTLCGHLYCWPCIYRWIIGFPPLDEETTTPPPRRCPVCKKEVSEDTLIPLYGRGPSARPSKNNETSHHHHHLIPERPTTAGVVNHRSVQHGFAEGSVLDHHHHPVAGMFGEMVYGRIFGGNSETTMYAYPNSYSYPSSMTTRQGRQVDRSMGRVCFFLCCCVMLCLLLF